jgi:hypothetical protein
MFSGGRQPSCDGTSRMTRECQVRICERLGVKFPGPTRNFVRGARSAGTAALPLDSFRAARIPGYGAGHKRACSRTG